MEQEPAAAIALDLGPRFLHAHRVDVDALRPRAVDAGHAQPLDGDHRTRPVGEREGTHPDIAAHGELRRRRERPRDGEVGIDARTHAGPDPEIRLQRPDVRVLHGQRQLHGPLFAHRPFDAQGPPLRQVGVEQNPRGP